jgi:hypothetical protein
MEGAEVSDDQGVADDDSPMLMSRFSTPFTPLYKRWNFVEKVPLCATFRGVRRALHA